MTLVWNSKNFLDKLAHQLIHEIAPNNAIVTFADNSDVIGAFAEASVRQFVSKMVAPARVSTGAVISETLCRNPAEVPQIDTIIWTPTPLPAIFEVGDFALVPNTSVHGILEIKRSNYSAVGKAIGTRLARCNDLVRPLIETEKQLDGRFPMGLGVICLYDPAQSDKPLSELLDSGRVVSLLTKKDGKIVPTIEGVYRFIDFLVMVRLRAKTTDGFILSHYGEIPFL